MPVLTNVPGFEFWVCIVGSGQVRSGQVRVGSSQAKSGQVRFRSHFRPPTRKQDGRGRRKKKNFGRLEPRKKPSTEAQPVPQEPPKRQDFLVPLDVTVEPLEPLEPLES